jgi:type I restriction enzyme S subunit
MGKQGSLAHGQPTRPPRAPFSLPPTWRWVRLGDILLKLTDGTHHSPPSSQSGDFLYITAKNIKNDGVFLADVSYVTAAVHEEIYARCNPQKGDVLYIKDGATTGVVTVNDLDEPFSMLSSVALLKVPSGINSRLLVYFLRAPFFYGQMRDLMKGSALPRVTLRRMAPALLPLPPAAEQERIVAKIDQMMGLCDQLEGAQAKREHTRDRLRASALAGLTAPMGREDGRGPQNTVRFVLNNGDRMVMKPGHVEEVRRTIRELAVKGRLVPHDPAEGEVASGYDRVEGPYPIPSSWVWRPVAKVATSRLGKMLDKAKNQGTPRRYLRNVNVRWFDFDLSDVKLMRFQEDELEEFTVIVGDVLICEGGEPGRAAVWDAREGGLCFQKALHRVRVSECLDPHFFVLFLRASSDAGRLVAQSTGATFHHLTGQALASVLIPIPRVAEQRRIVAKVGEMMALCEKLQAALNAAEAGRAKLLEAALATALVSHRG